MRSAVSKRMLLNKRARRFHYRLQRVRSSHGIGCPALGFRRCSYVRVGARSGHKVAAPAPFWRKPALGASKKIAGRKPAPIMLFNPLANNSNVPSAAMDGRAKAGAAGDGAKPWTAEGRRFFVRHSFVHKLCTAAQPFSCFTCFKAFLLSAVERLVQRGLEALITNTFGVDIPTDSGLRPNRFGVSPNRFGALSTAFPTSPCRAVGDGLSFLAGHHWMAPDE